MIVYSKKIIQFIHELKYAVKVILFSEMLLKVYGDRFYDKLEQCSYPIKIVVFNNKSMLGYFDGNFYELGFHECLMHTNKKQLWDIIRHELAHYMIFLKYGTTTNPHGAPFKELCLENGWDEEVYKATTCLEGSQEVENSEESSILRKIQKLMALAKSSNQNEAEQAMIKSQQLLLKHNMDSTYIGSETEEKMVLKRILKQKKENAKMRSIAIILDTFFVSTVYHRSESHTYLEILGSADNVEIAEYVACVLEDELEKLWDQAKKYAQLSGTIAKNSFFMGIARGYCNKVQAFKRTYDSNVMHALMVIEKKLVDAKAMVYQRLVQSKSQANYCGKSSAIGEKMGHALTINPALKQSSNSKMLITHAN